MDFSPFDEMQKAVDVVGTSAHEANKIAATIFGHDAAGRGFSASATNFWPDSIEKTIGRETRIGGSSGTVHAETACIFSAPATESSSLCVTDPFCPNCAKNMVEAGVTAIYVDHKGFGKDFAARRGDDFEKISLPLCTRAGVAVYRLYRKESRLEPLNDISGARKEPEDGIVILSAEDMKFEDGLARAQVTFSSRPFAAAFCTRQQERVFIACEARLLPGGMTQGRGKYSLTIEPMNRLLMVIRRKGLRIDKDFVFSSQVPAAREQVNMVGAGVARYLTAHPDKSRDQDGLVAAKQLAAAGVLTPVLVILPRR